MFFFEVTPDRFQKPVRFCCYSLPEITSKRMWFWIRRSWMVIDVFFELHLTVFKNLSGVIVLLAPRNNFEEDEILGAEVLDGH